MRRCIPGMGRWWSNAACTATIVLREKLCAAAAAPLPCGGSHRTCSAVAAGRNRGAGRRSGRAGDVLDRHRRGADDAGFGPVSTAFGWPGAELPAQVFAGDRIAAEAEVLSARESMSRPEGAIISVATMPRNQQCGSALNLPQCRLVVPAAGRGTLSAGGVLTATLWRCEM